MSEPATPQLPTHAAPGVEWIVVRDAAGHEHRVPLRPDGAYITAMRHAAQRRDARRRDARRPLEDLLEELTDTTSTLYELRRAVARDD